MAADWEDYVIASYRAGLQADRHITLPEFKRVLLDRRINTIQAHARKCAKQLAKVVSLQFAGEDNGQKLRWAFNDSYNVAVWKGMLRQYGCAPELTEYSFQCAKELLKLVGAK